MTGLRNGVYLNCRPDNNKQGETMDKIEKRRREQAACKNRQRDDMRARGLRRVEVWVPIGDQKKVRTFAEGLANNQGEHHD